MRRALVTGGSGYLGSVLVEALRERGYDVAVLDLVDAPGRSPSVRFIAGDVRDAAAAERACEGIDVVHHAVAQVPLVRDRGLFESVNVVGTETLLGAARRAGVGKVVHVSSSAVLGAPTHNPVAEDAVARPAEPYGRAKLAGEHAVARAQSAGLDVTVIRPRTILGPGRLGIFQLLFEWVRLGRRVFVLDGGANRYQFVHASDLADACIRASEQAGPDLFHVGATRFGTMAEAIGALVAHAGTGSRIRSLPRAIAAPTMRAAGALGLAPLAPYHALMYGRELWFDVRHAQTVLGWQPRFGNDEMLCEAYDWYLAHRTEVLARSGQSPHRSAVRPGLMRLLERFPW